MARKLQYKTFDQLVQKWLEEKGADLAYLMLDKFVGIGCWKRVEDSVNRCNKRVRTILKRGLCVYVLTEEK